MRNCVSFLVLLGIFGCAHTTGDESTISEDLEYDQKEEEFTQWLSENRKKQDEALIQFNYETPDGDGYELDKVKYQIDGDTLTASFVSSVWVGCMIIGDIQFRDDRLKLNIDHACDPNNDSYITEEADLEFTFVVALTDKNSPQEVSIGSEELINNTK